MVSNDKIVSSKLYEKLKVYNNYANECIFFKYIFDINDIKKDDSKRSPTEPDQNTFQPEFTHQIFGDDETIFGYKHLRIDYYLTPGLLEAYIGLSYKDKISAQRYEGIEPDDIFGAFSSFGCSPGYTRNLDKFCADKLPQDLAFRPFGDKIYEYNRNSQLFEIYKLEFTDETCISKKFHEYMERVQTMLIYYIETSCFIDTEDPQWSYYMLYEKRQNRYVTVGCVTVYNYYAYPDKKRARISQLMVII